MTSFTGRSARSCRKYLSLPRQDRTSATTVLAVNMKVYDITPMGKSRMTRADKWKKRPEVLRYRAFCDEVRLRVLSCRKAVHISPSFFDASELEQKETG